MACNSRAPKEQASQKWISGRVCLRVIGAWFLGLDSVDRQQLPTGGKFLASSITDLSMAAYFDVILADGFIRYRQHAAHCVSRCYTISE
jgi:hypothetical protein